MRVLVPVVAVALLLAGCSSHPAPSTAKPTTPRAQLLPTAADFPAGAVIEHVSRRELDRARDQLTESMKTATIEPPECGHKQVDIATAMSAAKSRTATVVAQNPTHAMTYAVGVVDGAEDLASFKDGVLGSCADVTTTMPTGGRTLSETSHTESVAPPQTLPADQTLTYRTTTTVALPANAGRTQTTQSMNGYAVVRGMTVEVRVNSLTGAVPPTEFNQLLTTAVTKVRNAK
jgi:hypothetical protein